MAAQPYIAVTAAYVEAVAAPSYGAVVEQLLVEQLLVEALDHAGCTLGSHEHAVALSLAPLSLAPLGAIDLPPSAAVDTTALQPLAPLYLSCELERAGVLKAAEQIAGLFAGGAVTQDLGPTAARIVEFWQGRQQRLSAAEREQLLEQTFEPHYFDPLMQQLCSSLVAIADNAGVAGLREEVGLEQAATALSEFLLQRATGMVSFAARDLLSTLTAALSFLRERSLQLAFGVHDLWSLVGLTAGGANQAGQQIRSRVDLARSGAAVITWLSQSSGNFPPDTLAPETQELAATAQRWLLAQQSLDRRPLR